MKQIIMLGVSLYIFAVSSSFIRCVQAAEIININHKYRIAFTDLTEKDVKPGDVVYVMTPEGGQAQMTVLETFPVMAKLTAAEGAGASAEAQFASISVGSQVVTMNKGSAGLTPRPAVVPVKKERPVAAAKTEIQPVNIESYSPGQALPQVVAPVAVPVVVSEAAVLPQAPPQPAGSDRVTLLEQRLDQMMANNVKLAGNITQLLAEKNTAQALADEKVAEAVAARKRTNELSALNADLTARLQALGATVTSLEQEKVSRQKEIDGLNVKLAELKKKLAKLVDIINTNMRSYEK